MRFRGAAFRLLPPPTAAVFPGGMRSRLDQQIQEIAARFASEITRAVGLGLAEELLRLRAEQEPEAAAKVRRPRRRAAKKRTRASK